jgi:hypothetical protein
MPHSPRANLSKVCEGQTTARILVSSGIGVFIGHALDEGFFNIEEKTGEMFDFALAYLKAPGAGKAAQDR